MIGCSRLAMLVILLASVVTRGESRPLEFVKQIGSGWLGEKPGWMSFVSFSPDGTMVASDGAATPGDVSGNLTVWTFPAEGSPPSMETRRPSVGRSWLAVALPLDLLSPYSSELSS